MGNWPRNFVIDPTGKYMLVANQRSHSITLFRLEEGTPVFTGKELSTPAPVCLEFLWPRNSSRLSFFRKSAVKGQEKGKMPERDPGKRILDQESLDPMSLINSSRVATRSKAPVKSEVVVIECCFWIPRICMQRCWASITTATPRGFKVDCMHSLICEVSLSCTWSLLANTSTMRAILLRPVM